MFKGVRRSFSKRYNADRPFFILAFVILGILVLFFVLGYVFSFYWHPSVNPPVSNAHVVKNNSLVNNTVTFNPSISKNLSQCDLLAKNPIFLNNCKIQVAIALRDESICNGVSDSIYQPFWDPSRKDYSFLISSNTSSIKSYNVTLKDYCWMALSYSKHVDYCSNLENSSLMEMCRGWQK